jgi:hypothetical protein
MIDQRSALTSGTDPAAAEIVDIAMIQQQTLHAHQEQQILSLARRVESKQIVEDGHT